MRKMRFLILAIVLGLFISFGCNGGGGGDDDTNNDDDYNFSGNLSEAFYLIVACKCA